MQEDLEAFRSASSSGDKNETAQYRTKLLADREHLEQRQQAMDAKLAGLFAKWDTIQHRAPQPDALRPQKDEILKEMRELLSNRTYLRSILNDLVATLEGGHADRRH